MTSWERVLQDKLEELGVQVRILHFTGDNSYPTEYTLISPGTQSNAQPTLDLAMVDFIEKLLKVTSTDEITSYKAMETALQLLTGNILALRTELLVIKDVVTKEQP